MPTYRLPISGFWFYDEALMTRGKPLTVDNNFFYRDGEVFPITGTTYMASDVHRRFLRTESWSLVSGFPGDEASGRQHGPHGHLDRLEEIHDAGRQALTKEYCVR